MGKKDSTRKVYTKEFKAEAVCLAEKREKPVGQVARDLGLNESMLGRWMTEARKATGTELPAFPGRGRPRDEELTRLRRENRMLREANEILKKAAVIFAQSESQ
jgi:transposase-like protein